MKLIRPVSLLLFSVFLISATNKEGCKGKQKTITLQNQNEVFDTHLGYHEGHAPNANNNLGTSEELPIFSWTVHGYPVTGRALIKFDLSSIPTKSKIISAKLSLFGMPVKYPSFAIPQGNQGDNKIVLQQVIEDWDENIATWNNQPASTPDGQVELSASLAQWNFDYTNVDVTNLINQMRSTNNFGFKILLSNESTYRSIGFLSSEYPDPSKNPKLVITYK